MFIGVICTCMPCFSKAIRHHNSQLQKWWNLVSSYLTGLRSAWTTVKGEITSSKNESTQMGASYKSHNFVPLNDVIVSNITSGGDSQQHGLADDVIHLKHDIQQEEYPTQMRN